MRKIVDNHALQKPNNAFDLGIQYRTGSSFKLTSFSHSDDGVGRASIWEDRVDGTRKRWRRSYGHKEAWELVVHVLNEARVGGDDEEVKDAMHILTHKVLAQDFSELVASYIDKGHQGQARSNSFFGSLGADFIQRGFKFAKALITRKVANVLRALSESQHPRDPEEAGGQHGHSTATV